MRTAEYRRHGLSRTLAHNSWRGMIDRCCNPAHRQYADYGGRGIAVCRRWRESFAAFFADMGERPPGTTLERKDNELGYEPGNCLWADRHAQARNRRDNCKLLYRGKTRLLVEWAETFGLKRLTVYRRVFVYGWSVEEALETSPGSRTPVLELDGRRLTVTEWAKEYGMNAETLRSRLKRMSLREALTTPNRYKSDRCVSPA